MAAIQGALHILLVGKNKKTHSLQFLFLLFIPQGTVTFKMAINSVFAMGIRSVSALSTTNTIASTGDVDEEEMTRVGVITSPERTNARLAAKIPHLEC